MHNEGKSIVAERLIRTLKNKIYKYMTSISKNVYINKLGGIVNEYNNTYHKTNKMKSIDVKSRTYIDFGVEKIQAWWYRLFLRLLTAFVLRKTGVQISIN